MISLGVLVHGEEQTELAMVRRFSVTCKQTCTSGTLLVIASSLF